MDSRFLGRDLNPGPLNLDPNLYQYYLLTYSMEQSPS